MLAPTSATTVVAELAARYCDALWASDVDTLETIFHPRARLYGAVGGELVEIERDAWLKIVGERAAGQGPARCWVRDVSHPAPDLVSAAIDCETLGDRYTDILTFMKLNGEWRVISKAFHAHGYAG